MATSKLALSNGFYKTLIGVNGEPATDIPFNLPSTLGTSGQVLGTDGTGNLAWVSEWTIAEQDLTFSNGLTKLNNDIKLGGTLDIGSSTSLLINQFESSDGYTSFNINDSRNVAGLYISKGRNIANSNVSSNSRLSSAFYLPFWQGDIDFENTVSVNSRAEAAYDQGGNQTSISKTSNVLLSSSCRTGNGFRSYGTLKLYTGSSSGDYPEHTTLETRLYERHTGNSFYQVPNILLSLNNSTGLSIVKRNYDNNSIFTNYSVSNKMSLSSERDYSDINGITQDYVFNVAQTGEYTYNDYIIKTKHISASGSYLGNNTGAISIVGLSMNDEVTRTSYITGYSKLNIVPIDYRINGTIGSTSYTDSIRFRVDLTSNGNNYIFDTYPILNSNGTGYTSVSSSSAILCVKNNNVARFRIYGDGRLGITNGLDEYILTSSKADDIGRILVSSGTYGSNVTWADKWRFVESNGNFHAAGTITSKSTSVSSDIKLKENIFDIDAEESLNKILSLNPKEYNFIGDTDKSYGLIAQEVEEILPNLIKEVDDYKSLDYIQIIPLLINAIKVLNKKIENGITK